MSIYGGEKHIKLLFGEICILIISGRFVKRIWITNKMSRYKEEKKHTRKTNVAEKEDGEAVKETARQNDNKSLQNRFIK